MAKSLEELKKELEQEQANKATAEEIAQRGKEAEKELKEKRMAIAEKHLATQKFQKVEVKQKYFDKEKNRDIDVRLKLLEAKAKKPLPDTS